MVALEIGNPCNESFADLRAPDAGARDGLFRPKRREAGVQCGGRCHRYRSQGHQCQIIAGRSRRYRIEKPDRERLDHRSLSARLGDWYEIDRASLIDNDLPPDGKVLFQGKGYLHKSVVGVSGMQNGGFVYRNHDIRTDLIDPHADGDQPVELLGCWGEFLKVHVKKGIGWTTQVCTNMNTTCA
jgi:hypothetical protein